MVSYLYRDKWLTEDAYISSQLRDSKSDFERVAVLRVHHLSWNRLKFKADFKISLPTCRSSGLRCYRTVIEKFRLVRTIPRTRFEISIMWKIYSAVVVILYLGSLSLKLELSMMAEEIGAISDLCKSKVKTFFCGQYFRKAEIRFYVQLYQNDSL